MAGETGLAGGDTPARSGEAAPAAEIDVEHLADRVYRLLVGEARLARARGERVRWPPPMGAAGRTERPR
jgi:hypothetical protein